MSPVEPRRLGAVEVFVEGSGPESIVFLHGWPDTDRLWDRQAEALRARFRGVRFASPGFEAGQPRYAYSAGSRRNLQWVRRG